MDHRRAPGLDAEWLMASMWDWLRQTRSNPPGTASTDPDAAELYRASLEQFEQLMRVAAEAGPASRPLPLFYALSQAGRAVAAARGGHDHQHHGLTLDREIPADPLEALVKPSGVMNAPGQFQVVAGCVQSPTIDSGVELGALIRALPEVSSEPMASTRWPRALPLFVKSWEPVPLHGHTRITLDIDAEAVTLAELAKILKNYPTASTKITVNQVVAQSFATLPYAPAPTGQGVDLIWVGEENDLEAAVPQYRFWNWRWLQPSLSGQSIPPSPLMTWWLLLYGLSMLARYFPVPWTRALDLDRSPSAVVLDLVMTRAMDALPHLIYEAVTGRPVRFPGGVGPDPFDRRHGILG